MSRPPALRHVLPNIGDKITVLNRTYTVTTVEPASDYTYAVEAFTADTDAYMSLAINHERCVGCFAALPKGSGSVCRGCAHLITTD